jgi:hypothetical protein
MKNVRGEESGVRGYRSDRMDRKLTIRDKNLSRETANAVKSRVKGKGRKGGLGINGERAD